jgi:hypothetical protein
MNYSIADKELAKNWLRLAKKSLLSKTPPSPPQSSLPDSPECKRDKNGHAIWCSGGRPRLP